MDMTKIFTFLPVPTTIHFGIGSRFKTAEKVKEFGAKRVLIITDPGVVGAGLMVDVEKSLKGAGIEAVTYDKIVPNSGLSLVNEAVKLMKESKAKVVVGVGGGSSLDTAKAVAVMAGNPGEFGDYEGMHKIKNPGLPVIALPTTSGTGSEVTIFSVITDDKKHLKTVAGSSYLCPKVAICDPELTLSVPPAVTASTGMDALAHALESFTNLNTQPISDCLTSKAIELIGEWLRPAVAKGDNLEARYYMLLGSLLAALGFSSTRLGLAHAFAMPLGSAPCNLAHGVANAIMLPAVMEFNLMGNIPKFVQVAKAMGECVDGLSAIDAAYQAVEAVRRLSEDIGIPKSLKEVGIKEEWFEGIAEESMKSGNIAVNPRKPVVEDMIEICRRAF
ncbi:MAG TPA: iron-containing alcohol dehydrogenase [Candidatus Methylomirabilis sp.]